MRWYALTFKCKKYIQWLRKKFYSSNKKTVLSAIDNILTLISYEKI